MKNCQKYQRGYFMPPVNELKWAKKEYIDHPPIWCSVDLRDGNQALVVPMSLEEKLEFFQLLVEVGFKEIEVGFPAASETEFEFVRALIEKDLIPEDVTIQVLTQSREHIIRKTFDSLKGCKTPVIVHLYNSTSLAQREQVFKKSKDEITEIAVSGAKLLEQIASEMEGDFYFEYSPESFTGTEPEYALEVCNAVIDVWQPTPDHKVIINLPVTVEMSLPHVYASQIEYMSDNMNRRDSIVLSLHPHNDRGCGVADSELGLLAGGDRIEGTLFGNGERTGNVDIVTLALNMFSHGVDPKLNLENLPFIVATYERLTGMAVGDRCPYAGRLVFAAFSGSHQDAIAKGMNWREEKHLDTWSVPYLPIDPKDVGREYESDVIRINSQSGKGGIGYLMEKQFGYDLPPKMREVFGYAVKSVSDHLHKELSPEEVLDIFMKDFINVSDPMKLLECHYVQRNGIEAEVTIEMNGETLVLAGHGNGRLDAVCNALCDRYHPGFSVSTYKEHALEKGSKSRAISYIEISNGETSSWGAGRNTDIMTSSVYALISAINRLEKAGE